MELNRIKQSKSTNFTALHVLELARRPNTPQAVEEIARVAKKICPDCFVGVTSGGKEQGIRIATGTTKKNTRINKKITREIVNILWELDFVNSVLTVAGKYGIYNPGEHGYGITRTLETGNIELDILPLSLMFRDEPELLVPETTEEFSAAGEFVSSRIINEYTKHLRLVKDKT